MFGRDDILIKDIKHKKISITIILLIILCLSSGAVLLLVNGPKIMRNHVRGLTLTQKNLNIIATWDKMECDGYTLTITAGGKKTVVDDYQENEYVIENVVPGTTYSVDIQGLLANGYNSRTTSKSIEAGKLKQTLKINIAVYDGFKGDRFRIEAKGKGDVYFESGNEKVAGVDSNGNVKLKRKGHCVIKAAVSGDGIYDKAAKEVAVNVYPEKLDAAKKVSASNISDSRAVVKWDAVDFAKKYVLMKKNAATGKFDELQTIEDGSTQAEITRNNGEYAVKAKAEVKDKVIEGDVSKTVTIKGTTDSARSYSSGKTIKNLNESNMTRIREIHGDGSTNIPQSMSMTKDYYVVSYVNRGGSAGKFVSYNKDGSFAKMSSCSGMGHANGSTYNPNTNKFYVVKTHKSTKTASCSTYDGDSKDSAGTFNLPRVTSGIAYDESNNKYYLSKGNEIYVCDSDFKVEKFIHKFVRYNHAQDIGAYNGVVLVCTWVSGKTSYIDMYRASDGAYLGSYDVSIGELESVVVDDGYLIILMNTLGSNKDRLYRTDERIAIP